MSFSQLAFAIFLLLVFRFAESQVSHRTTNGDVIVQLFQWDWKDVKKLCENVTLNYGIGAVQVSPPQPHRIIHRPLKNRSIARPWWERYQPIRLSVGKTRSGTADEFRDMVAICVQNNVAVYAEVVLTHLVASDAGLGRATSKDWYLVDEQDMSISLPGNNSIFFQKEDFVSGKEPCRMTAPLQTMEDYANLHHCHALTPYTYADFSPLIKLNLTKAAVLQQIKDFLEELAGYGVTGLSVISSTFVDPEEMVAAFYQLNLEGSTAFSTGRFLYVEIVDNSTDEFLLSKYSGISSVSMGGFSGIAAQILSDAVLRGVTHSPFEGVRKVFFNTFASLSEANSHRILAFEHHEQLHGHGNGNVNYDFIRPLSKDQRVIATVILLLLEPELGIPRLVWDYGTAKGDYWMGVPHRNFVSISPFEDGSTWNDLFKAKWMEKVLRLRRENYFDKPAAPGNSFALIHHDFVLNRTDPAPNPPPVSVAVLYAITFDKARIPMNSFGSEYTATPSETCSVTFAIIASHTTGTLTLENSSPYLAGGTYHFEPNIENNDLSVQVIGSQEVCGSDIITDAVLDETDCISVHQNEEQPTRVVVQLPVLPSESARPHFYIVAVQATGSGSCYDKWLIPLDYE